jgi:hypothetical protein
MQVNFQFQHGDYLKSNNRSDIDEWVFESYDTMRKLAIESNWAGNILEDIHINPNCIELLHEYYSRYNTFKEFCDANYIDIGDSDGITELLFNLNANPRAMEFLRDHKEWIVWERLARNRHAVPMIEEFLQGMTVEKLSNIKDARGSITEDAFKYFSKIDNPCWFMGSLGENRNAMHLIERFIDIVPTYAILQNPNAIHMIAKHLQSVNRLSMMHTCFILMNPNAMQLVIDNTDKMYLGAMIFQKVRYNYEFISQSRMELNVSIRFHPRFVEQQLNELVYMD